MELSEIKELATNFEKLRTKVMSAKKNSSAIVDYLKQYEPEKHNIMDTAVRPDKLITTDDKGTTKSVSVARLSIPMQKKIVGLAAAFLCGNPIQLSGSPANEAEKKMLAVVLKTWSKNKLYFDSKTLAKIMMSETEAAEIWYVQPAPERYWANTPNEGRKLRIRMKIIANSLGDSLYPVFDNSGDMVAFGRGYKLSVDGKDEEHFDVYTEDTVYLGVKKESSWEMATEANQLGKIPVIYYCQPKPEWSDVQTLIDRFEKTLSNHSDTNDYYSSPMVKVKGTVKGFASKGETGKVLELEEGADAEYMSWDQSPKSLELEFKNLRSLIYDLTDTPDISIEQMKSLGTYSGVALKLLFLAAHLKAADKEEIFGKCMQRRINLIIEAMTKVNVELERGSGIEITPQFEYFLPKDEEGMVNMLVNAVGGGKPIMTTETAVRKNPLVDDPEQEIELLKEQATIEEVTV